MIARPILLGLTVCVGFCAMSPRALCQDANQTQDQQILLPAESSAKAKALLAPEARPMLATTVLSSVVAGVTAYLSVRFLMRYFKHHRLSPFAIYCISVSVISLFFLFPHS